MIGSGGGIPATSSFLEHLRSLATKHGAILVFDEVMTSRMHSGGGLQSQLATASRPDLTTLGKYLGGGLNFGAFGGGREIMSMFDPRRTGHLAHAGTFNNNVLTMAAGKAGLEHIFTPARARELHDLGETLRRRLSDVCRGTVMRWTGRGSILCVHFTTTPAEDITCPEHVQAVGQELYDVLHLFLLERDYHIAARGFIALSLANTKSEIDEFVELIEEFVMSFRSILAMN